MAHSAEVKAAVLAALHAGTSPGDIPAMYGVTERTARRWIKDGSRTKKMSVKKKEEKEQAVSDLMLIYLRTLLHTLNVQVEFFGDTDWLSEQSAENVAILHGVIADKGSRVLDILVELERQQQKYIDAQPNDLDDSA